MHAESGLPPTWLVHSAAASSDRRLLGGKAQCLHQLLGAGVAIPDWYCATSDAFVAIAIPAVRDILDRLDRQDRPPDAQLVELEQISVELQARISALELPRDLVAAAHAAFADLTSSVGTVAVRSSAAEEDSADHSFAGQFESYLHVPKDGLEQAIRQCWASAFAPRALWYRARNGIPCCDIRMAVLIQRMVDAVSAGVAVTLDRALSANEVVISVAFGLGEGVVRDLADSDTYHVDRSTMVCRRQIQHKRRRVLRDPAGTGTRVESVPDELRDAPVLSHDQIAAVARQALAIEAFFGVPQDLEWAFDPSGKLFFVQARPVTSRANKTRSAFAARTPIVLDSANIVESFPGITLPLTFSLASKVYSDVFAGMIRGLRARWQGPADAESAVTRLLAHVRGHIYYNMNAWYEMLSVLPGGADTRRAWEHSVGVSEPVEPDGETRWAERLAAVMLGGKLLRRRANMRRLDRRIAAVLEQATAVFQRTPTGPPLYRQYSQLYAKLIGDWHVNMESDLLTAKLLDWLTTAVTAAGLDRRRPGFVQELLARNRTLESLAPVKSVISLASAVAADPALTALLASHTDEDAWNVIETEPAYAAFHALARRHIARFGDRRSEDLKLEVPRLTEHPHKLLALLRSQAACPVPPGRATGFRSFIARELLRHPVRTGVVLLLARCTRAGLEDREILRLHRSRVFGFARRLFLAQAATLVEAGELDAGEDVFYLTVDELFGFEHGTTPETDLRAAVARRRRAFASYRRSPPPPHRLVIAGLVNAASCAAVTAPEPAVDAPDALVGIPCSPGVVVARARIVSRPDDEPPLVGEALVAETTDPGWVFLMSSASAMVVERGSVLSHSAILGRELGIPTVVGVHEALRVIPAGATIRVDGTLGRVSCLPEADTREAAVAGHA
jgi:phosphohistidine swiveling domain-containing protein